MNAPAPNRQILLAEAPKSKLGPEQHSDVPNPEAAAFRSNWLKCFKY